MPESTTTSCADYTARIVDALIDVIQKSATPELAQTQLLMARRLALSGNVVPSRIPAPKNITEVGGYLNLLESLSARDLRSEMLSSVLGVAGAGFPAGVFPQAPSLFFVNVENDRPGAGASQAAIPVNFAMRADFIGPFRTLLTAVHAAGCQLPLLSASAPLPLAAPGSAPPADLLRCLGRTLTVAPTAALTDASADALALGRLTAGPAGTDRVLARAIDPTTLRDELALLYTTEQVAASSVRDALDWVWNGSAFAPA